MARIRGLKPDYFKDEDLACLPFEARLLFQGLWCLADKKGRLKDRPKYIKAEIFPYDKIDIEKLLNLLANPQIQDRPQKVFIRRYIVNNTKYIDIPEFLTHQNPHHTEKDSVIPEYNGDITVKYPLQERESQEDTVHGSLFMDRDTVQDMDSEHNDAHREEFEEFWHIYPARNGKKLEKEQTWRRFERIGPQEISLVLQATRNYANSDMVRKGIGIKDPKRFLGIAEKGQEYWREWIKPEVTEHTKSKNAQTIERVLNKMREKDEGRRSEQDNPKTVSTIP